MTNATREEWERVYRDTDFHVYAPTPFVLRVGEFSAPLAKLHAEHQVTYSAFLTAWNPRSEILSNAENEARQRQLLATLAEAGVVAVEGLGCDPVGKWPGEASVLALGVGRGRAFELGRSFEQNAVLWAGPKAVPELVWCGGDPSATP